MIREEKHIVWNFTILVGFLGAGFWVEFLLGLTQPNTLLGALGRMFVHAGGEHILTNLGGVFLVGLVIAAFAHPIEFVGVLGSTIAINTLLYQSLPVASLSVVLFALVGATVLFLVGVITEVRHFEGVGSQLLVVATALVLLVVVGVRFQRQLLHDAAVVLFNQPVQIDAPGYTRESSFVYIAGCFLRMCGSRWFAAFRYAADKILF